MNNLVRTLAVIAVLLGVTCGLFIYMSGRSESSMDSQSKSNIRQIVFGLAGSQMKYKTLYDFYNNELAAAHLFLSPYMPKKRYSELTKKYPEILGASAQSRKAGESEFNEFNSYILEYDAKTGQYELRDKYNPKLRETWTSGGDGK
jgi:hypothetical protein